ncbi:hypothetical protein GW17_00017055, partial [Ensete ventricosum]
VYISFRLKDLYRGMVEDLITMNLIVVLAMGQKWYSDDDCCNSCEEVRAAYQKKGWALTNPDLIDQVYKNVFLHLNFGFGVTIYNFL